MGAPKIVGVSWIWSSRLLEGGIYPISLRGSKGLITCPRWWAPFCIKKTTHSSNYKKRCAHVEFLLIRSFMHLHSYLFSTIYTSFSTFSFSEFGIFLLEVMWGWAYGCFSASCRQHPFYFCMSLFVLIEFVYSLVALKNFE